MAPKRESVDDELLPDLFGEARWGKVVRQVGLTRRQAQVARLVCRGCSDKQIARRLGISIHSVRLHLKKLYARVGVRGRISLLIQLVLVDRRNRKQGKPDRRRPA